MFDAITTIILYILGLVLGFLGSMLIIELARLAIQALKIMLM